MKNHLSRRTITAAALVVSLLVLIGCGDSIATLNKLASVGSIQENAPVTAHVRIEISASPARVWELLVDAPAWPKWQKGIASVDASGPLTEGKRFRWKTGGTEINSQVQLIEAERRLSWTGTALTAKAIHVWELTPEPGGRTLVTVKESMDGPFMAQMYPSEKLADADTKWLQALKVAAEQQR
jgi:uncharacterized protein YndB with AHSA1/START domain